MTLVRDSHICVVYIFFGILVIMAANGADTSFVFILLSDLKHWTCQNDFMSMEMRPARPAGL